eukprot:4541794-Alexandrium_andersonii.AAC.1
MAEHDKAPKGGSQAEAVLGCGSGLPLLAPSNVALHHDAREAAGLNVALQAWNRRRPLHSHVVVGLVPPGYALLW